MSFNDTKLYSVLKNRCPRCHKGHFFETDKIYNLKKFDKMNHNCPACGEDLEHETGFYYGAMYVSYGLTVIFGVLLYLVLCVVFNFSHITFLFVMPVLLILFSPWFYRTARLTWINLFVSYKKEEIKQ